MKKAVPLSKEIMEWIENLRPAGKRCWVNNDPEYLEEMIDSGQAFFFQYRGRDYFIEQGRNGYLIQDPQIDNPGNDYTDYPGHEAAKTPAELMALPFLDGKTMFERFDELLFFD